MATMTFTAADIWCKCNASGGKDTQTGTIAVSGIPAGSTIQRVTLNFFVSHTYSTPYINRVSVNGAKVWEDYQPGSGNKSVDVTGLFTGSSVSLECYAQNGSSNTKRSNTAYTGITLVVEYVIPKSSFTLDKTGLDAGGSLTVNISRLSGSYTHRVTVTLGTRSLTQTDVGTQAVFNLPLDWCDQLPNAAQGQGTVTVETFLGGTSMGANAANFTLTVPASVVPVIGSLTATLLDGAWGLYVQGHSRCRLTAGNIAGAYGSTIKSVVIGGDGSSGTGTSWDTHILRTAGSIVFTATATDSRGRTAQKTVAVTVTPYAPVAITGRTAARCGTDGTADRSGTSILAGVSYTMTAIGDNAATVQVHWRTGGGAWTEAPDWPAVSGTEQIILAGTAALDSAYEVRFTVADALTTAVQTGAVSVAEAFMVWSKKHKSFGFGCYPGGEKRIQLADDWDIYHQGRKITGSTRIPGGADLNSYTTPGMYYNDYNGDVASMQHAPVPYAFALLVEKSAGVKQTFTRYDTGDPRMWVRNYYNGAWGAWVEMVSTGTVGWYAVQAARPVGSLYLSTDSTSPASLFGGTWTQITDRFLLAAGGSYGVGSYGGEAYHTLTVNEMPSHAHSQRVTINRSVNAAANRVTIVGGGDTWSAADNNQINATGGGSGHNNMPPYYAVYMWRRIG